MDIQKKFPSYPFREDFRNTVEEWDYPWNYFFDQNVEKPKDLMSKLAWGYRATHCSTPS